MKDFFFTDVTDGVPAPSFREKIKTSLGKFKGRVCVTVESKKKRSLNQNSYYHGCIVQAYVHGIQEMWDEKIGHAQGHEDLKRECNWKEKVNQETGLVKRFTLSTADLTTGEFEEYTERCRRFIQEYFGIVVPLPGQQAEIEY